MIYGTVLDILIDSGSIEVEYLNTVCSKNNIERYEKKD